jgi:CubicO group peptidase (beta-lactamase class C family)
MIFRKFCVSLFLTILISIVSIHVCAQHPRFNPEEIRAKIDSISNNYHIPSIGFGIVSTDSIILSDAVGFANIQLNKRADKKTVYRVGSVTKSFIALGILSLVEEGLLSLEDPLSELVPELDIQNRWEYRSPVLLKHLLEHTAGFRDIYLKEYAVDVDTHIPPLEEIVQRHPEYWISRWEPGTRHAYSNCGYTLLGLIIEKTTGMPYEDYLTKVILDPVGMVNSDFRGRDHSNLAYSYDGKGNLQTPYPLMEHPAGYLHTTPEDMGKFVHWMINKTVINDETLISEGLFRKMNRPLSILGADERLVGYGLGNVTIFANGLRGQGHNGGIDHYYSNYNYFEEAGVGFYYTMTYMSMDAIQEINNLFYNILLPDNQILPPYHLYEYPEEFTGWYANRSYRIELLKIVDELLNPMRIYLDGDTLRLSNFTGFSKAISHEGDNYFRAVDEPMPSIWLGIYDDKTVISSSHRGLGWYYERQGFLQVMWKTILFIVSFLWIFVALIGSVGIYLYKLIRRKKRNYLHTGVFFYQVFAGVLLLITMYLSTQLQDLHVIATMNTTTVLLAMSSGLIPLMIIAGLINIFKNPGSRPLWSHVFLYGTYCAWVVFLGILFSYGLIPIITWMG